MKMENDGEPTEPFLASANVDINSDKQMDLLTCLTDWQNEWLKIN